MMLLKKKTIIGLFLCTLVFSSSIPMLLGIQSSPNKVFGEDIMTLSQVNSTASLSSSLALELNEGGNVVASPEIYAFCMIGDNPVITRGVILDKYFELEDGEIVKGEIPQTNEFVIIGEKLATRAGLKIGDLIIFTGSTRPGIYQFKIDAIYNSPSSADDALVSLDIARELAGLGSDHVSSIRVKATNRTTLMDELEEKDEPVIISDQSGTDTAVNTNLTEEEKEQLTVAFKYEPEQFKDSGGSFVSVFIQEGGDSIKIVVLTFIILDIALTFIGATAIIARAIIERRPDIGTLSAIGANKNYLRKLIAKDIILISIPASILGTFAGYVIVNLIGSHSLLLMFGQTIRPMVDSTILAQIGISTMLIFIISGIIVNEALLNANPQAMISDADKSSDDAIPELISLLGAEQ